MLLDPILGFIHMYGLMIAVGILAAFAVLEWFGKRLRLSGKMRDFIFYDALVSIAFGGTVCFMIGYTIFKKRLPENLSGLLRIAPCCITVAHGFGRIGCFFAGCCYGKPTDSWLGVKFPDLPVKVHPTQLYEAAFLFLLFGVLTFLLFHKKGDILSPFI